MKKTCLACSKTVRGRSDKKFCSSDCRSHHHNLKNQEDRHIFRRINRRLMTNRKILQHLQFRGIEIISHFDLLKLGFDFDFLTHISYSNGGNQYYYCYDYGYRSFGDQKYFIHHNYLIT